MFSRRGLLLGSPALLAGIPAAAQSGTHEPGTQTSDALADISPRERLPQGTGTGPTVDIRAIVERGRLRIALPGFDSSPFFYTPNGKLEGLDVGLARSIADDLEVDAAFDRSPKGFNQAVQLVAQGGADIAICKLSRTLRRGRLIRYSRPYARLNHGLLIHRARFAAEARNRDTTEVIRNFDGDLGAIANSSYADFAARNFPKARLRTFESWSGMIDAIRQGRIDAAYRDDFEIKKLLVDDPSLTLVARSVTLTDLTDTLAICIRPDAPHLVEFINLFLELSQFEQPLTGDDLLLRYRKMTGI